MCKRRPVCGRKLGLHSCEQACGRSGAKSPTCTSTTQDAIAKQRVWKEPIPVTAASGRHLREACNSKQEFVLASSARMEIASEPIGNSQSWSAMREFPRRETVTIHKLPTMFQHQLVFSGPIRSEATLGEPGLQSLEQPGGHCLRPGPAARASCSGPASSSAPRRCASLVSRAARPTPHATSDDCGKRVRMTFGSWSPKPLAISSGHGGAKCVTGSQLHGPERRHVFEKSPCFRQAEQRPFNPYPPTAIPLRGACGPLVHRSHLALPRRE